jgi:queuine tRNA-ribosyltransferase
MRTMRRHIIAGDFYSYYLEQRELIVRCDENHPPVPTRVKKRKNTLSLGNYEVVKQEGGFHSIRHVSSGEVMHSVTDPMIEAMRLYVDQLNITETLSGHDEGSFIVWDVGLGAGTNAMATVREYERLVKKRDYLDSNYKASKTISALTGASCVKNPALSRHVKHPAPAAILAKGSGRHHGSLLSGYSSEGDFRHPIAFPDIPLICI